MPQYTIVPAKSTEDLGDYEELPRVPEETAPNLLIAESKAVAMARRLREEGIEYPYVMVYEEGQESPAACLVAEMPSEWSNAVRVTKDIQ